MDPTTTQAPATSVVAPKSAHGDGAALRAEHRGHQARTSQGTWPIDGKIRGWPGPVLTARQWQELAEASGRAMEVTPASQSLENVQVRVHHMDAAGDRRPGGLSRPSSSEQVTDKPEIEVALCKSYNRWPIADYVCDAGPNAEGPLKTVVLLPLLAHAGRSWTVLRLVQATNWCMVGVFMRPHRGRSVCCYDDRTSIGYTMP